MLQIFRAALHKFEPDPAYPTCALPKDVKKCAPFGAFADWDQITDKIIKPGSKDGLNFCLKMIPDNSTEAFLPLLQFNIYKK